MRENEEGWQNLRRRERCQSIQYDVQVPAVACELDTTDLKKELLCDGRPVARYCACIDNECNGFRVANVFVNLISDSRVARNVDHGQRFLECGESDDRRIALQRCMCGEGLVIHQLIVRGQSAPRCC